MMENAKIEYVHQMRHFGWFFKHFVPQKITLKFPKKSFSVLFFLFENECQTPFRDRILYKKVSDKLSLSFLLLATFIHIHEKKKKKMAVVVDFFFCQIAWWLYCEIKNTKWYPRLPKQSAVQKYYCTSLMTLYTPTFSQVLRFLISKIRL